MILQKLLAKSPRLEAWMELLELATGSLLFFFLQFHLFAVSSIILGPAAFHRDVAFMDKYYIADVGIPLVLLAILVHGLVAMRKAPWKFQEMRVFMQHSRRLAHLDTWAWLVQIVTGMAILVLAAAHVWSVLPHTSITAAASAGRVQSGHFSLLFSLLLVAEIHAMVGLYRLLVKWSWWHRKKFTTYLVYSTLFFVVLGFVALIFLYFLNLKGLT